MPEYRQISVEVAQQIAEEFDKSQVVIVAWDPVHALTHITTYGVSAEDKVQAAQGGEFIAAALDLDRSKRQTYEDFRGDFDAALFKESLELLKLIRNRQGCTGPMLQRAERILNAAGHGVRSGG